MKKKILLFIPIIIILVLSFSLFIYNNKEYKIKRVLNNEYYSYLPQEALDQIKDGKELKDIMSTNELSSSFDNISNLMELLYGVTLRNEEELEAAKPQREKLINQIKTAEFLTDFYSTVAGWNDQYTDGLGLFGLGSEGIGYLLNKLGLDGENHYQWADSCREFAERASNLKVLNPKKFNEGFKKKIEVTGISFSPKEGTILVNEEKKLSPTIKPSSITNANITYTSSNTSVVIVNNSGNILNYKHTLTEEEKHCNH